MSGGALTHPSPDQLAAFGAGRLEDEESASIEQHLAVCEPCCHRLKVHPGEDSYVALIREAGSRFESSLSEAGQPTNPQWAVNANTPRVAELGKHSVETVMLVSEATPAIELELPKELLEHPRYRILRRLGRGGMGAVYEAEHRLMNRRVALKVIRPELVSSPQAVLRFQREVRAAAKLVHPHVVTAFDAEQAGQSHFLVMEFVEGMNLAELVHEGQPLPVAMACDLIRETALGLQQAHEQGMVHRDIKPGNLMVCGVDPNQLDGDISIKILDFGLARFASEESDAGPETSAQVVLGTPDFMAPEQARDAHAADIRSDIYSLGCSLFFTLTGRVPHPRNGSAVEKALAHLERDIEPLEKFRDDIPPGLQRILDRMTAKNPADRYATPAEVATALAPFGAMAEPMNRGDEPAAHRPLTAGIQRVLAATGLVGFVLLMAVIVHVVTDKGDLRIESRVEELSVLLFQNGTPFRRLDVLPGDSSLRLPTGEYTFECRENHGGVQFLPTKVRLTRASQKTLRIIPRSSAKQPLDESMP